VGGKGKVQERFDQRQLRNNSFFSEKSEPPKGLTDKGRKISRQGKTRPPFKTVQVG